MKPDMIEVNEQNRTYWFDNDTFFSIENVVSFADSASTHRLEDKDGTKWIVPKNFIAIEIKVAEWAL